MGIGPNRFLAKTGAGLNKPDGLDIIDVTNYQEVYARLKLDDLCGIKLRNMIRLNNFGIYTVTEFANAPVYLLKAAFASIVGYYWHLRLRGWEIDQYENERKSFGHSYALQTPYTADEELAPLIMKLTTKMCQRLRKGGYYCHGIHFLVMFRDGTHWHRGHTIERDLFSTTEIYKELFRLFAQCPYRKPVRNLAVSVFNLVDARNIQLGLFENTLRNERLYTAIDAVNQKWGDFVITPARMMGMNSTIIDRVAFGGVKELEEMIVRN